VTLDILPSLFEEYKIYEMFVHWVECRTFTELYITLVLSSLYDQVVLRVYRKRRKGTWLEQTVKRRCISSPQSFSLHIGRWPYLDRKRNQSLPNRNDKSGSWGEDYHSRKVSDIVMNVWALMFACARYFRLMFNARCLLQLLLPRATHYEEPTREFRI